MTIQRRQSRPSLDEMTYDEALAKIKALRESRRILKDVTVRKKKVQAVKKKAERKTKSQKLLAQLTPEQLAFLMQSYNGDNSNGS